MTPTRINIDISVVIFMLAAVDVGMVNKLPFDSGVQCLRKIGPDCRIQIKAESFNQEGTKYKYWLGVFISLTSMKVNKYNAH